MASTRMSPRRKPPPPPKTIPIYSPNGVPPGEGGFGDLPLGESNLAVEGAPGRALMERAALQESQRRPEWHSHWGINE